MAANYYSDLNADPLTTLVDDLAADGELVRVLEPTKFSTRAVYCLLGDSEVVLASRNAPNSADISITRGAMNTEAGDHPAGTQIVILTKETGPGLLMEFLQGRVAEDAGQAPVRRSAARTPAERHHTAAPSSSAQTAATSPVDDRSDPTNRIEPHPDRKDD
jgi:hypothetical protein